MSRLAQEIRDGNLILRADHPLRGNFAFSFGNHPLGLFAVQAETPFSLQLIRAWNIQKDTYDPFTGLYVPTKPVRMFNLLQKNHLMFLLEMDPIGKIVVDKLAFTCGEVLRADTVPYDFDPISLAVNDKEQSLRWEVAELKNLEFIG